MPGPSGNQPKKAGKNKWKPSPAGRYFSGTGGDIIVGNPGAGVTRKKIIVSDAIRGWGSHNSKTPYGN